MGKYTMIKDLTVAMPTEVNINNASVYLIHEKPEIAFYPHLEALKICRNACISVVWLQSNWYEWQIDWTNWNEEYRTVENLLNRLHEKYSGNNCHMNEW